MTDTTHLRHEQPVEPTTVELSGERTDQATPPPPPPSAPPSAPSASPFPSPRRRVPPPPPPAGPPSPRGGGVVPSPSPAPAPVHHHHYYPVQPAEPERPARFTLARLSPVRNGTALAAGLLLLPVSGEVFHVFGDEPGAMLAALAAAGLLELRSNALNRTGAWLVRVLTCNLLASSVTTPAGLYLYSYVFTGVWS